MYLYIFKFYVVPQNKTGPEIRLGDGDNPLALGSPCEGQGTPTASTPSMSYFLLGEPAGRQSEPHALPELHQRATKYDRSPLKRLHANPQTAQEPSKNARASAKTQLQLQGAPVTEMIIKRKVLHCFSLLVILRGYLEAT